MIKYQSIKYLFLTFFQLLYAKQNSNNFIISERSEQKNFGSAPPALTNHSTCSAGEISKRFYSPD